MKTNDAHVSERSQRHLAAGVLKQASQDLRRFQGATSAVERELYLDAYRWLMCDDHSWPFSFPNVCRMLNRVPDELRQQLIGDLSFGFFGKWARRCGRAAQRLQTSVSRLFASGPSARTRYA